MRRRKRGQASLVGPVKAFSAGNAIGDVLASDGSLFAGFTTVQAAMIRVGADTRITLDASNTVTLKSISLGTLVANDFSFAA